jgi:hypothetical protein
MLCVVFEGNPVWLMWFAHWWVGGCIWSRRTGWHCGQCADSFVDDFAHCSCYPLIVRRGWGHPRKCVHPRNVGHPSSSLLGVAVVTGCFALVQYCLCCLYDALEVFYLLCCCSSCGSCNCFDALHQCLLAFDCRMRLSVISVCGNRRSQRFWGKSSATPANTLRKCDLKLQMATSAAFCWWHPGGTNSMFILQVLQI